MPFEHIADNAVFQRLAGSVRQFGVGQCILSLQRQKMAFLSGRER